MITQPLEPVLFDSLTRSLRALSTTVDDRPGPNAMSSHRTPDGDLGPFDATVEAPLDPLFEKLTERFDAEAESRLEWWDCCPRQQKKCKLKVIAGFPQYVVCKCGEIAVMDISEKDGVCQVQPLTRLKQFGTEFVRLQRKGHSYLFNAKGLVEQHFNYPAPSERILRVPCMTNVKHCEVFHKVIKRRER